MIIPKEFVINNITIKVVYKNSIVREELGESEEILGEFNPITGEIALAEYCRDTPVSSSVMYNTFYHELAHAILWSIGHTDWTDEILVQCLGTTIQSYIKTCIQ